MFETQVFFASCWYKWFLLCCTSCTQRLKWGAILDLICHSIVVSKSDDASGSSAQIVAAGYGSTIRNLSVFVPWHKIKTVRPVHTASLSAPCPSSLWSVWLSGVVSSSRRDISAQHAFFRILNYRFSRNTQTHTRPIYPHPQTPSHLIIGQIPNSRFEWAFFSVFFCLFLFCLKHTWDKNKLTTGISSVSLIIMIHVLACLSRRPSVRKEELCVCS